MHWILQNNIYSEDGWERLTTALDRLEVSYSVHKCIPFIGTLDPEPVPPPGNVIVMGSYTLAREAQKRGWVPGVFLNDNFDFTVQLQNWGTHMINSDAWVGRFDSVPEQENPFFIRPVHDSKAFTGYVTDWPDFIEYQKQIIELQPDWATVTPDTQVIVSSKKTIRREYRTWVVDKRVVTASLYKQGTWKHYEECHDQNILTYAETCASIWSPDRAYVLDIFETDDGMFIGEVNNLNSAGFYAADMQKLVAALEEMKFDETT
jgi:hypothetical protein